MKNSDTELLLFLFKHEFRCQVKEKGYERKSSVVSRHSSFGGGKSRRQFVEKSNSETQLSMKHLLEINSSPFVTPDRTGRHYGQITPMNWSSWKHPTRPSRSVSGPLTFSSTARRQSGGPISGIRSHLFSESAGMKRVWSRRTPRNFLLFNFPSWTNSPGKLVWYTQARY